MKLKGISSIMTTLLLSVVISFAQAPSQTADWSVNVKETTESGIYEIRFSASIELGWHIYSVADKLANTSFDVESIEGCEIVEDLYDISRPKDDGTNLYFEGMASLGMKVKLIEEPASIKGYISWTACREGMCTMGEKEIELPIKSETNQAVIMSAEEDDAASGKDTDGALWLLLIEAMLWGFAMLLTPCVFPMVPMTVSFFLKSSDTAARGKFNAFMYGVFIVLLYTLPITIIIAATRLIGGDAVTADIFNWLSTHWIPNIIFFVIFMAFAASFFGAFEITLPSSIVNKSDSKTGEAGVLGVFFMALTLVLVSFSCIGPIVGSVLIKSTQGEFWTPMITMLVFSVTFALPFTILALFPSLMKKMKNGSWLNSVKVVLGFIEIALGLKFLSTADQTYHWGILDREVYLAIWIVTFSLLGFYLLGKIRFKNDDAQDKPLSTFRLALVIAVFSFVVYLIPGMWGAPLKALSGYLPPISTQDFVVYSHADGNIVTGSYGASTDASSNEYGLTLPMGLSGYFTIEEGLEASKAESKPVFVDITGHGCVNCREMEQRVWSEPEVLRMLREEYIVVALYVDDKTKLKKEDWISDESGRVFKDLGRKNSYIARSLFGVNAQPNYVLLNSEGERLAPVRGYNLDVDGFRDFLQSGIENFNK